MGFPKCKSKRFVKNGIVRKKQRYKWTWFSSNRGDIKSKSQNSVIRWIKQYGEEIEKAFPVDKTKRHCQVIEIDEMWHCVGKKIVDWHWGRHPLGGLRNKRSNSLAKGFVIIWLASKEKRFAIQNL